MADLELSPRLRAILDGHFAQLKPSLASLGSVSVLDSFDPSFHTWFEPEHQGVHIQRQSQQVATAPQRAGVPSQGLSAVVPINFASFAPGRGSSSVDSFKRPKIPAAKPWEGSCSSDGHSSKEAEADSLVTWARGLVILMSPRVKDSFLRGRAHVPPEVHDGLVFEAVKQSAGVDQLRSTVYSLRRLDEWLSFRFTPLHGFDCPDVCVAWFLRDNLVDGSHVSQSLVSGLRFAESTLKFPFSVSSTSLRALSKGPTKSPKQAPSASVRVVRHFWVVASEASYSMPLRGVAAIFLVMCVCALRGIDAQRSSFDGEHGAGSSYKFFSACAYNSKRRTSMPWACPVFIFGASRAWYDALRFVWGSRDFMFPAIARGASLASASGVLNSPASAYLIVRYLREILRLPSLSMSVEDASKLRRHSFRHWIANMMRVLKFAWSDFFQGGRWKESHIMPLRYAQEVQFVASVDIIVRVLQACETAMSQQPVDSWPLFGGWERFLPDRRFTSSDAPPPFSYAPEGSEAGSDSDSSADEDAGANVRSAPAVSRRVLPAGWSRTETTLSCGRVLPAFHGPSGERARSMAEAWRVFRAPAAASATLPTSSPPAHVLRLSALSLGLDVSVWWTEDAVFYDGVVALFDGELVTVDYDDGETVTHAIADTFIAAAVDVASFTAMLATGGGPQTQRPAPPSGQCSDAQCIVPSKNGRHSGIHIFPQPASRRRSRGPSPS